MTDFHQFPSILNVFQSGIFTSRNLSISGNQFQGISNFNRKIFESIVPFPFNPITCINPKGAFIIGTL